QQRIADLRLCPAEHSDQFNRLLKAVTKTYDLGKNSIFDRAVDNSTDAMLKQRLVNWRFSRDLFRDQCSCVVSPGSHIKTGSDVNRSSRVILGNRRQSILNNPEMVGRPVKQEVNSPNQRRLSRNFQRVDFVNGS